VHEENKDREQLQSEEQNETIEIALDGLYMHCIFLF
jgi:hypothetical protein